MSQADATQEAFSRSSIVSHAIRFWNTLKPGSRSATERAFQTRPELPKLNCIRRYYGCEFGKFQTLQEKLRIPIYFTHPYCSWERGGATSRGSRSRTSSRSKTFSIPDQEKRSITKIPAKFAFQFRQNCLEAKGVTKKKSKRDSTRSIPWTLVHLSSEFSKKI